MYKTQRSIRSGFTLIELLVVVSIIALLLAILLPSLAKARAQTKALVGQTRMREVARGSFCYYAEYGRLPPTLTNFVGAGLNWKGGMDWLGVGDHAGGPGITWGDPNDPQTGDPKGLAAAPRFGRIWEYIKDEKVFLCPEDKPGMSGGSKLLGGGGNGKFSFTMFSNLGLADPEQIPVEGIKQAGGSRSGPKEIKRAKRNMANIPLFVEEHPDGIGMNGEHVEGNFNFGTDYVVGRHPPFGRRLARIDGQLTSVRQGSTHIAFVDNHVEAVPINFGLTESDVKPSSVGGQGLAGIPYTAKGLLYHYGIKYEEKYVP